MKEVLLVNSTASCQRKKKRCCDSSTTEFDLYFLVQTLSFFAADKRFWLHILHGLFHNVDHFGTALTSRYTITELVTVKQLVTTATGIITGSSDEHAHVWAIESLNALCESLPGDFEQTEEWTTIWNNVWVSAVGCLRATTTKREIHRLFSLLRSLFQTGVVDREHMLAEYDPTGGQSFSKEAGVDKINLVINIMCTFPQHFPQHRMGANDLHIVKHLLEPNAAGGAWPSAWTVAHGLCSLITGTCASSVGRPFYVKDPAELASAFLPEIFINIHSFGLSWSHTPPPWFAREWWHFPCAYGIVVSYPPRGFLLTS